MKKKRLLLFIVLLLMALVPLKTSELFSVTTEAASKKATNQKAHQVYEKKMNSIVAKYTSVSLYYKYANIIGDNTDELIISYQPAGNSGLNLEIYSYKSGKAKQILSQVGYAGRVIAYKNKKLILYTCSHANEIYEYYVTKGGKYQKAVSKNRYARKAGAGKDTAWEYYNKAGKKITKAKFKKSIKGFKGSKKTLNIGKFKEWKKRPSAATSTENATFSLSPMSIVNFGVSGSYLNVSANDTIDKNNQRTTIKSLSLPLNGSCDWRYVNLGYRYPQNKTDESISYQRMMELVDNSKGGIDNGYYLMLIYVTNGKVNKVVFQAS